MSVRLRVLGGSVSGLACALALGRRAGIDEVHIYERDDAEGCAHRVGHGYLLMQNGVRAFRELGLGHVLERYSRLSRALFQDGAGVPVRTEPLEDVYCLRRAAIVEGLRAALPPCAVRFGQCVQHVDLDGPRVRAVRFRNGDGFETDPRDLVIGAEGWLSPTCEALNPGLERPLSRVMEIVTSTELPTLAEELGGCFVKTIIPDRGLAFGLLAPTTTRVIGFLQFDSRRHPPLPRRATPADFRRFLLEVLPDPPEPVKTYLLHADYATAHLWTPVNADLPPRLCCDNAILVGDAAHPLLPFTSQGVSAALEDAIILADVLSSTAHERAAVAAALSGFCADRRRDMTAYVEGGRRILASFLDAASEFVPPYVDGAASRLEEHLTLPRGGLRILFHALDVDGSGCLDRAELHRALRLFEIPMLDGDSDRLFDELDLDGDGRLTIHEVVSALGGTLPCSPLLQRLRGELSPRRVQLHTERARCRAWFQVLDEDGDGAIVRSEFQRALLLLGGVSRGEDLFESLDRNGDGRVDMEEFAEGMSRRMRSEDPAAEVDPLFSDRAVDIPVLRSRAYNHRWAVQPPDVIPLTAADPDFPVCSSIIEAVQRYARPGYLSYGPPEGLPDLRDAAAQRFSARRGIPCGQDTVFVTDGAASALFLVARFALAEPGDEAIIFDPVDFLFERSVRAAGGVPRRLPLRQGSFDPDELRALVSPRTRLLAICSPHNPLGRVWTRAELEQLSQVAIENDLWIMSDEVWSDIVYPPNVHVSTASLGPEVARRTFSIFGFSKSYGLAGLRLGLLVSPDADHQGRIVRIAHADDTAYGVSTLSQVAGTAALQTADAWLARFVEHLRHQRDYALARLLRMSGVSCRVPQGTFVAFPHVGRDAEALAARLLEQYRIAVVPGSSRFFGPGAEGHLRISYATSRAVLSEGLDRLEAGLLAESAHAPDITCTLAR